MLSQPKKKVKELKVLDPKASQNLGKLSRLNKDI